MGDLAGWLHFHLVCLLSYSPKTRASGESAIDFLLTLRPLYLGYGAGC